MPAGVVAAVAVAALAIAFSMGGFAASPKATVVCEACGHRFEISGDDYHGANGRVRARCPRCDKGALAPVIAICPHCDKAIRYADLGPPDAPRGERVCPHCGKAVPAENARRRAR